MHLILLGAEAIKVLVFWSFLGFSGVLGQGI